MTPTRQRSSSTTRWLLAFGRPVLWPLGISMLCRVAPLAAGAALLGYAAFAVMTAVLSGSGSPLTTLGVIVALAAAKGLFHYLEHYTGHWVAFRTLAMMRVFFYQRLAALAPAITYRHRTGDLLDRVTRDIDRLEVFFAHTVVPTIAAVIVPTGVVAGFAVAGHPAVALAVTPFFVLLGAVLPFLGQRHSQQAEGTTVRIGGQLSAHLTDTIGGLRELTAYAAGSLRRAEQQRLDDESAARHRIVARWAATRASVGQLARVGALITVVVTGQLTGTSPAAIAAMVAVTVATYPALAGVDGFAASLGSTRTAVRRVRAVAEEAPATPEPPVAEAWEPPPGAPEIRLTGVGFTYPGRNAPALSGIESTIPAGGTVGLLGHTGSGKSTIGALLARIWDPTDGRI